MLWACHLTDLRAAGQGKEARFRGLLRPFLDAGSWDATSFAVWLWAPQATLQGEVFGPFSFGREFHSQPGNVEGSIADGTILPPGAL